MKIVITGATGNVGLSVIKSLNKITHNLNIVAGIRSLEEDKQKLSNYKLDFVKFDFMDFTTYESAISGSQILFLLRPPQISDTEKIF